MPENTIIKNSNELVHFMADLANEKDYTVIEIWETDEYGNISLIKYIRNKDEIDLFLKSINDER